MDVVIDDIAVDATLEFETSEGIADGESTGKGGLHRLVAAAFAVAVLERVRCSGTRPTAGVSLPRRRWEGANLEGRRWESDRAHRAERAGPER